MSPYELAVGLRYVRSRKGSGRNTFISFIALISMAGIALGVAALIVVLSVMNGFEDELRNRLTSVTGHAWVSRADGLAGWQELRRDLLAYPGITGAVPVIELFLNEESELA